MGVLVGEAVAIAPGVGESAISGDGVVVEAAGLSRIAGVLDGSASTVRAMTVGKRSVGYDCALPETEQPVNAIDRSRNPAQGWFLKKTNSREMILAAGRIGFISRLELGL